MLFRSVGLLPDMADRYPHEFSGGQRQRIVVQGEVPSALKPPSGCRFHTRCAQVMPRCSHDDPPLLDLGAGRSVACHLHTAPHAAPHATSHAPPAAGS